jgi:hypothetical protein
MNLLSLIKSKFQSKPEVKKSHEHEWEPQYSTGSFDTKWSRDGKIGFGKSMVFKCQCGQWAVKHYGDDVHVLLD